MISRLMLIQISALKLVSKNIQSVTKSLGDENYEDERDKLLDEFDLRQIHGLAFDIKTHEQSIKDSLNNHPGLIVD